MAGFWDGYQATRAGNVATSLDARNSANVAADKAQGHGLLDLIPGLFSTLGAIGGGVGGSFIEPGGGTVVGGVAGAGGGQALGKAIENRLTGDKTTVGGEAKQAAEGAGGQLIGGAVGHVAGAALGKVGGSLIGRGASTLDNVANDQVAKAVATDLPSGTKTEGINGILSKLQQHGLPVQSGQLIDSLGQYGEAGDALNGIKENLVSQGNPVKIDMGKLLSGAFKTQPTLGDMKAKGTDASKIAGGLRSLLTPTLHPDQDSLLTGMAHPSDILQATTDLFNARPQSSAEGKVYDALRQSLVGKINNEGGVGKLISAYHTDNNPEDMKYLLDAAKGNPSIAGDMAGVLNSAKGLQDVQRGLIPHINANNIVKSASQIAADSAPNVTKPAGRTIMSTGAKTALALAPFTHGISAVLPAFEGARMAAGTGAVRNVTGRALSGVGAGISKLANPLGDAGGLNIDAIPGLNGIRSGGGVGATVGRLAGNYLGSPESAGTPADQTLPQGASDGTQGVTGAQAPTSTNDPSNVFSTDNLKALALNDIETTGGKNLDKIATLSSLFNQQQKLSTADQSTVSNIQDAFSFLDTADQQIQDMGGTGAKNSIGGIPLIGQYLEPKVAAYKQTKVDLATALAKALTGSARPAASVIARFEESLPQPTDAPDKAAQKLANLRQELANKGANYGLDSTGNPVTNQ